MDGRNWYKNSNNSGSSYKSLESARPLIIILVHSWSQIDLENLITGLTAFSAKRKQKIVIFVIFLVEGPVSGRSREVFQPWNFPKSCIFFLATALINLMMSKFGSVINTFADSFSFFIKR